MDTWLRYIEQTKGGPDVKKERKQFTRDYKLEAVRLSYQRSSVVELAGELGLRPALIYRWRSEFAVTGEKSFPGNGNGRTSEDELTRLKRELADARMERDILKKAMAIFSKHPG